MNSNFVIRGLTKDNFSDYVKRMVVKYKISYLEAITELCEANNIEPEDIKSILNEEIMSQLREEAYSRNMIQRSGKLRFD